MRGCGLIKIIIAVTATTMTMILTACALFSPCPPVKTCHFSRSVSPGSLNKSSKQCNMGIKVIGLPYRRLYLTSKNGSLLLAGGLLHQVGQPVLLADLHVELWSHLSLGGNCQAD